MFLCIDVLSRCGISLLFLQVYPPYSSFTEIVRLFQFKGECRDADPDPPAGEENHDDPRYQLDYS
jgi:hypothetical protein